MILPRDRAIAVWLLRLKLWRIVQSRDDLFRCARLQPRWGTRWIWKSMVRRQTRDGLHHAPMCPGNEWSGVELVFQGCTCGAARMAKRPA